jgi:uncharacterized membrane protein
VDLNEEFKDPKYDVVIVGDLDATALGTANLETLKAAIEQGKGFAMLGGYHSFGAGGYGDSPLADVLPVTIDRLERQDFDAAIRDDLHLRGPISPVPITAHPVIHLAAEQANVAAWKALPPLSGANRWQSVKAAVGVRVLLESPAGDPLLVAGSYGRGRVLALAGDSTWRWWLQGQQAAHKRFWRQAVLWLAQREDAEQDEVWIQLDQRRFHPGGRVSFTAGVRAAAGDAIPDAVLQAELVTPSGERRPLRLIRDRDHWRATSDALQEPGDYAIEVNAERNGQPLGQARGELLVFDQDVELSNPVTDHQQLARLAEMTRDAGGRMIAPEQLPALIDELRQRPPEMEIEIQRKWQLGDTAFDAWTFFLCLVGLLSVEWLLRKRWGLV